MTTSHLVEVLDTTIAAGGAHQRTFTPAELPGDVFLLYVEVAGPIDAEVAWTIDGRADGVGPHDERFIVTGGFGPFGNAEPVPYVVPIRGVPIYLIAANPGPSPALIRYWAYAVTTTLAPAELLPPIVEGHSTGSLLDNAIAAGATLYLDGWNHPGYARLLVAGRCTQAWAIDAEWLAIGYNTEDVPIQRWTETLAAGPAGELHADVPLRTGAVRLTLRNTSGADATITASSRILRA